jgi:hypothetical protein
MGSRLGAAVVARLDSGNRIVTAGCSFRNWVETITKIRRMANMSMSDTIITCGIRRRFG